MFHFLTEDAPKPRHLEPRMWEVQFKMAPRTGLSAASCQKALEELFQDDSA